MALLLGRQSAGTTADFNGATHVGAWPFVAVASGQLTKIFAQTKVANATGVVTLGIYDDVTGNPTNRLGFATAANATGTGVFFAVLATPVTIVSGTTYWLGWRNSVEDMNFQGTTGTGYHEASSAADFPNPFGSSGSGTVDAILWGESTDSIVIPDSLFHELSGPSSDYGPDPFTSSFQLSTSFAAGVAPVTIDLDTQGLSHTRALGTIVVTTPTILSPAGLVHTRGTSTPKVNPTIVTTGLAHTRALGTHKINPTITMTGLVHTRALGNPFIGAAITPASIVHTRALGAITISEKSFATSIVHTRGLGTHKVSPTIVMTSIVHTRTLGIPTTTGGGGGGGGTSTLQWVMDHFHVRNR